MAGKVPVTDVIVRIPDGLSERLAAVSDTCSARLRESSSLSPISAK